MDEEECPTSFGLSSLGEKIVKNKDASVSEVFRVAPRTAVAMLASNIEGILTKMLSSQLRRGAGRPVDS